MYQQKNGRSFYSLSIISLLFLAFALAGCNHGGSSSNDSTTSAPVSKSSGSGQFEGIITMKMETERQEMIAGYPCEHWLMGEKQNLDMCAAKGLGYFGMGGQGGGLSALKNLAFSPKLLAEAATHPEWVKFLEGGAFPLKLTSTE